MKVGFWKDICKEALAINYFNMRSRQLTYHYINETWPVKIVKSRSRF